MKTPGHCPCTRMMPIGMIASGRAATSAARTRKERGGGDMDARGAGPPRGRDPRRGLPVGQKIAVDGYTKFRGGRQEEDADGGLKQEGGDDQAVHRQAGARAGAAQAGGGSVPPRPPLPPTYS